MSLESFFEDTPTTPEEPKKLVRTIPEIIRQRRAQMLVHSCIYYELNDNIVTDHKWQEWADELEKLQKEHPEHLKIGFYDSHFADWDGATGAHLPHRDPWVMRKAQYLLSIRDMP